MVIPAFSSQVFTVATVSVTLTSSRCFLEQLQPGHWPKIVVSSWKGSTNPPLYMAVRFRGSRTKPCNTPCYDVFFGTFIHTVPEKSCWEVIQDKTRPRSRNPYVSQCGLNSTPVGGIECVFDIQQSLEFSASFAKRTTVLRQVIATLQASPKGFIAISSHNGLKQLLSRIATLKWLCSYLCYDFRYRGSF